MKKLLITFLFFSFGIGFINAQITTIKADGGTVVTTLSYGIKVNAKSTLKRDWIILNDKSCPLELFNDVGINTSYRDPGYRFVPIGKINPLEPIVAFEIHFVLYDVFGVHIKTLSMSEIQDINTPLDLKAIGSTWYASENQIGEYLFCVAYVANVRTSSGKIWRYKPQSIQEELSKLQIAYEEDYKPKPITDDK